MNENRKKPDGKVDIRLIRKQYDMLIGKLDYNDMLMQGEIKTDESEPIHFMEYSFICGQVSILEWVLGMAGAITQDDRYHSRRFRKEEEKDD